MYVLGRKQIKNLQKGSFEHLLFLFFPLNDDDNDEYSERQLFMEV